MNNYYRQNNNSSRINNNDNYDMYSPNDSYYTALELIEEAAQDEKNAVKFYDYMTGIVPSEEDKQILRGIRDDERRHYDLFRRLYYELTCRMLPESENDDFVPPETYCSGLKMGIKNELDAVVKYRQILYALCYRTHINIMTGIITDELRHADYLNLLYSKNECYEEEEGHEE